MKGHAVAARPGEEDNDDDGENDDDDNDDDDDDDDDNEMRLWCWCSSQDAATEFVSLHQKCHLLTFDPTSPSNISFFALFQLTKSLISPKMSSCFLIQLQRNCTISFTNNLPGVLLNCLFY